MSPDGIRIAVRVRKDVLQEADRRSRGAAPRRSRSAFYAVSGTCSRPPEESSVTAIRERVMKTLLASLGAAVAVVATSEAATVTIPAEKDNTLYESVTGTLSNGSG